MFGKGGQSGSRLRERTGDVHGQVRCQRRWRGGIGSPGRGRLTLTLRDRRRAPSWSWGAVARRHPVPAEDSRGVDDHDDPDLATTGRPPPWLTSGCATCCRPRAGPTWPSGRRPRCVAGLVRAVHPAADDRSPGRRPRPVGMAQPPRANRSALRPGPRRLRRRQGRAAAAAGTVRAPRHGAAVEGRRGRHGRAGPGRPVPRRGSRCSYPRRSGYVCAAEPTLTATWSSPLASPVESRPR